jgi:hypothetical protein
MKTFRMNYLIFAILFSVTSVLNAKIIYVDGFANNGGDGSSWDKAFTTITDGLNAATSGDEVWVASDIYSGQYIMKSGVSVYGGFIATETSLDQRDYIKNRTILKNNTGLVLKNQSGLAEDAYFDGFDIKEARTTSGNGGGGYLSPKMHLRNCRILNCTSEAGTGGGIALDAGASVENCIFAGNSSKGIGGGLNMNKGGMAINCIFINNFSRGNSGGGIAASSSADGSIYPVIVNCLIANNEAYANGGGIWTQGGYITNCTIVRNKTQREDAQGNGGGISLDGVSSGETLLRSGELYNSVIWGNDAIKPDADRKQIFIPRYAPDGTVIFYKGKLSHCAIQNLENITEYPDNIIFPTSQINLSSDNSGVKFASPSETAGLISAFDPTTFITSFDLTSYNYQWQTQSGSVLINAGDKAKNTFVSTDITGANRIYDQLIDIGAYEYKTMTATTNIQDNSRLTCFLSSDRNYLILNTEGRAGISVYDMSGLLIKKQTIRGGSIDIAELPAGVYIITDGKTTARFIK